MPFLARVQNTMLTPGGGQFNEQTGAPYQAPATPVPAVQTPAMAQPTLSQMPAPTPPGLATMPGIMANRASPTNQAPATVPTTPPPASVATSTAPVAPAVTPPASPSTTNPGTTSAAAPSQLDITQSPTLSAQDALNMYMANNGGLVNGYDVNNQQQMSQIGAGTTYMSQLQNILSTPGAQNDSNPAYTWLVQNGYLTPASNSMSGNVELGSKGQDWMNVQNSAGVLSQGNPWGASPYQGAGAGLDVADRGKMGYNANYGYLAQPGNLTYTMDNGIGNSIARYGPALAAAGVSALGIPAWAMSGINAANSLSNGGPVGSTLANVALQGAGAAGLIPAPVAQAIKYGNMAYGAYNLSQNPGSIPGAAAGQFLSRAPNWLLNSNGGG